MYMHMDETTESTWILRMSAVFASERCLSKICVHLREVLFKRGVWLRERCMSVL